MALKRAFNILINLLFFIPLEACHHQMDEYLEEIDFQDSTTFIPEKHDSLMPPKPPSDSIHNSNNTDTTYSSTTSQDTINIVEFSSDTITVAHWNIGNFALGKSSNTTINSTNASNMANNYHAFLDSLNLDIIGICEFDPTFSKNGDKAKETVFNNFQYYYIGKKYSYNCNAVFSKIQLYNNQESFFSNSVQTRYFSKSTINIKGNDVLFIETHLDWNQGSNGANCRKRQINELVNTFKDYPFIIICADFNTSTIEEFKPFIDAGFIMINGGDRGTLNTHPASNPTSPIDNIILKGFEVINVSVIGDAKLSDHLLIKGTLKYKN